MLTVVIQGANELYIPGIVRCLPDHEEEERVPTRWERMVEALRKSKDAERKQKHVPGRWEKIPVGPGRRVQVGVKTVPETLQGEFEFGPSRSEEWVAEVAPMWGLFGPRTVSLAVLLMVVAGAHAQVVAAPQSATVSVTDTAAVAMPVSATANAAHRLAVTDPATSSLESYVARVRKDNVAVVASMGAIWTDAGRLTRMSTDVRAMRPHDLISVVVSENLAAETDGTVKNSRASNASSSITGLIGALKAGNALQNLINQNSASGLNAQGQSASNSSLSTTFGGQVVEVLPNGMLVIEAARQVEFSQQVQTIVLRGLVRPEDISQQNQVVSTAISSLELQVRGKGIINDYTHRQNVLVRMLRDILVF
jgi:flagellar L-ring protein FlgH